jgi:hypothetical protein
VKLPSPEHSYARIMEQCKSNRPFAFSRWGDGEWEAVLDLKREEDANCDGHQYFSSLKSALQDILKSNPSYFLGMQKLAYHKIMGRKIDSYLREHKITTEWLNADAFHNASIRGELGSFFSWLGRKKVLLVGPEYLRILEVFPFVFCEIPEKNCWLDKESRLEEIKNRIRSEHCEVVLFCAGMTANWFVDKLYGFFDGVILDMGSVFDPYAGKQTRNYHKTLVGVTSGKTNSGFEK